MKILLTGSGGQLAGEIIRAADGHEVVAFEKNRLDITDFEGVRGTVSEVRPDAIINCAAYNDVDGAESRWTEAFLINGIGVRNLAVASAGVDAVLVHFSTDYVFDGGSDKPYTIADSPSPISIYGKSKLLGEELLKSHAKKFFLIRTSSVFGKGKNSFPIKILDSAEKSKELSVADDLISSPTYAYDLARAVLKLIATGNFGLYHITNSGHCSRYEWASFILEKTGYNGALKRAKSADFNPPAKRPAFSVLDNFPIERVLVGALSSWQDATERFLRR